MKIIIYDIKYFQFFSILCAIVTGCSSSHVVIEVDGVIYDTDFQRGYFSKTPRPRSKDLESGRMVTAYDIPMDEETKALTRKSLESMIGTPYDRLGLLLWPLGIHSQKKLYCYEAAWELLETAGYSIRRPERKVSARHIVQSLHNMKGLTGTRMTERQLWDKHPEGA